MIKPSKEIWHRDDFPLLCTWRNLETIVEIGVERGNFSEIFLTRAYNHRLYIGVDQYKPVPEYPYDRQSDLIMASQIYARFPKSTLILGSSEQVAHGVANRQLGRLDRVEVDFVYIDADHSEEAVLKDIELWWPLVSRRGILAGHDYDETHPGVVAAVDSFANNHNVDVFITPDFPNSWYCYKSGIPGPGWSRM